MQEGWAKDAYIEVRAARLEAEATVAALHERRSESLGKPLQGIEDRRTLDRYLEQLADEERSQKHVIGILEQEEAKALLAWQERKRELEAMVKLREHAYEDYCLDETRREQAELDEWAVTRRTA